MILSYLFVAVALSWSSFKTPTTDTPSPIGSYSNGCIQGAQKAQLDHPYYQVIRQQNNRYYGHPNLINFLDRLATNAHNKGLPVLLVGDMSMPRGGPFKGGHASHQIGLDADIWFRMVKKPLASKDLVKPWALNIVKDNYYEINNKYYSKDIYTLVKLAATDAQTDRIFVHPAIKQALCNDTPQEERSWLHKVRPWWGHNAHMHVRLVCPKGSTYCETQAPIPTAGDGCGAEVDKWLDNFKHPKKPKPSTGKKPPKKKPKILPEQCQLMLKAV